MKKEVFLLLIIVFFISGCTGSNFEENKGHPSDVSHDLDLDSVLNMCHGLSQEDCNQYKMNFVDSVINTYAGYHNNYDSLISEYNEDVLFIDWDNSLPESIGSPTGGEYSLDPEYPFLLKEVKNTQHEIIYSEFEKPYLITKYKVHGEPRRIGVGLTFNEETSQQNKIYTTNEEFIEFFFENNNPCLFFDSTACGSWILWNQGSTFCCWPQTMLISGVWAYVDTSGAYYEIQNFRKYFASEGMIGRSLLKVARGDWYFHGDITAHVPHKDSLTPECGWAEKEGTDCICELDQTKDKLVIIIKEGGIYDNSQLINSINYFISSVDLDLGISGSLQKFSGTTFEELDLFIEEKYYNSGVAYLILIGEDLPITQMVPGTEGIRLYGAQKLGIVDNNKIVEGRNTYCYDVAISYILPPLHSPTLCKKGETECDSGQLLKCAEENWVSTGESC